VVLMMMENHSFDNIFGMLGRGDGFTLGANGLLPPLAKPGDTAAALACSASGRERYPRRAPSAADPSRRCEHQSSRTESC
jgi:hypothetical protein